MLIQIRNHYIRYAWSESAKIMKATQLMGRAYLCDNLEIANSLGNIEGGHSCLLAAVRLVRGTGNFPHRLISCTTVGLGSVESRIIGRNDIRVLEDSDEAASNDSVPRAGVQTVRVRYHVHLRDDRVANIDSGMSWQNGWQGLGQGDQGLANPS